ncbi:MAG: DUF6431 domain-containing protein [bacterium]
MIAIFMDVYKSFDRPFDQKRYDDLIRALAVSIRSDLVCPFCREEGRQGHFIRWGSHERILSAGCEEKMKARFQRIRCTDCGHTHALFPESIIPFSSFPAQLQTDIIQSYLDGSESSLRELMRTAISQGSAGNVIRRFIREWKDRLRQTGASIRSPLGEITEKCISSFRLQFMQAGAVPVFWYGRLLQKVPDLQRTTGPV